MCIQLTHLSLAANMIDQSALASLTAWLAKPATPLLSLDLSRNAFGDAGGEGVARALRTNSKLQTLHLDECMLTDATCRKMIKTLKHNESLRKVRSPALPHSLPLHADEAQRRRSAGCPPPRLEAWRDAHVHMRMLVRCTMHVPSHDMYMLMLG